MSDARRQIMANIRRSLGRDELPESAQLELRSRISEPEQGIRPHFDQDLAERFVEKLEAVAGTVTRVPSLKQVPAAVQNYLDQYQINAKLVMSADSTLAQIDWPQDWQIEHRPASGGDHVSVTGVFAGIAETGTLVLLSGPVHPTTLNFLPDDHIALIRADQIVSHLEDLWWLMRKHAHMPRTVNLITGPSRTADVEQTIQLGAHGPRRLHVVLVESSA